jgi:hypothetical protein
MELKGDLNFIITPPFVNPPKIHHNSFGGGADLKMAYNKKILALIAILIFVILKEALLK